MELRTLLPGNSILAPPLLITGVSGVAGWNALPYFLRLWPGQVIGIRPKTTWQFVADGVVALDTEDRAGLHALFEKHRFGAVLNCTGNCALKSCELDPAMARRTNIDSAVNIAEAARRFGARLVHLSSDLVFSGKGAGGYVETDPVDPVTVYGKTMAKGEQAVRDIDPEAAILRISLPMGPSFNRHAGAIDWIQSRFRHGRPATLYFDEVRSCTYTDDLNRVFGRFLAKRSRRRIPLRRPARYNALSDRSNRQSRRRLRSASSQGLSAHRGGADAAARGQREHEQRQAAYGVGRRSVSAVAGGRGIAADAIGNGTSCGRQRNGAACMVGGAAVSLSVSTDLGSLWPLAVAPEGRRLIARGPSPWEETP